MARASSSFPVVCSLAYLVSRRPSKIRHRKMCNRYGKAGWSEHAIQNELELSRDASRCFDWRKPKNPR